MTTSLKAIVRCASIPVSRPRRASSSPSIHSMLSEKPARPSSRVSDTRAGEHFPLSTTTADFPVRLWTALRFSACSKILRRARSTPSWSTRSIASLAAWLILPKSSRPSMPAEFFRIRNPAVQHHDFDRTANPQYSAVLRAVRTRGNWRTDTRQDRGLQAQGHVDGGHLPLGYDLKERKLIANPVEATLVVRLFGLYLELGCVSKLKARLDQEGIMSKKRLRCREPVGRNFLFARRCVRHSAKPHLSGTGSPPRADPSRQTRGYCSEAVLGPGPGSAPERQSGTPKWSQGKLPEHAGWTATGWPRQSIHSSPHLKNGRRYRYYVGQATNDGSEAANKCARLPAFEVERGYAKAPVVLAVR